MSEKNAYTPFRAKIPSARTGGNARERNARKTKVLSGWVFSQHQKKKNQYTTQRSLTPPKLCRLASTPFSKQPCELHRDAQSHARANHPKPEQQVIHRTLRPPTLPTGMPQQQRSQRLLRPTRMYKIRGHAGDRMLGHAQSAHDSYTAHRAFEAARDQHVVDLVWRWERERRASFAFAFACGGGGGGESEVEHWDLVGRRVDHVVLNDSVEVLVLWRCCCCCWCWYEQSFWVFFIFDFDFLAFVVFASIIWSTVHYYCLLRRRRHRRRRRGRNPFRDTQIPHAELFVHVSVSSQS